MAHRVQSQYADLTDPVCGQWADFKGCTTPLAAVQLAAECYTWARGYNAHGAMWPFNPMMLVDGVPAYRIAADELGGSWAIIADQIDGATARPAESYISQVAA